MTFTIAVSILALLFTVFSFWRLNATQGRLVSYAPRTFSAALTQYQTRIRLPLVLYASGAKPIVVRDIRLTLDKDGNETVVLEWISTRDRLRPEKDDELRFASAFAISGRSALTVFAEFGDDGNEMQYLAKEASFQAKVEVLQGHQKDWRKVVQFQLHTGSIEHPERYITYRNSAL